MATQACSADVGNARVKFHGGASWLYNLFNGVAEDAIKRNLRNLVRVFISSRPGIENFYRNVGETHFAYGGWATGRWNFKILLSSLSLPKLTYSV